MECLERFGVTIEVGDWAFLDYLKVSTLIKKGLPKGICYEMSYKNNVKKLNRQLAYQRLED